MKGSHVDFGRTEVPEQCLKLCNGMFLYRQKEKVQCSSLCSQILGLFQD